MVVHAKFYFYIFHILSTSIYYFHLNQFGIFVLLYCFVNRKLNLPISHVQKKKLSNMCISESIFRMYERTVCCSLSKLLFLMIFRIKFGNRVFTVLFAKLSGSEKDHNSGRFSIVDVMFQIQKKSLRYNKISMCFDATIVKKWIFFNEFHNS